MWAALVALVKRAGVIVELKQPDVTVIITALMF